MVAPVLAMLSGLTIAAFALRLTVAATVATTAKVSALLALPVVALLMDLPALVVFSALNTVLLVSVYAAVGAGTRLHPFAARLTVFETGGLAIGQLSAAQALLNSLLLGEIALHIGLHALR